MTTTKCVNSTMAALGTRISTCPRPATSTVTIRMILLAPNPVMVNLCTIHVGELALNPLVSVIERRPIHDDHAHTLPPIF